MDIDAPDYFAKSPVKQSNARKDKPATQHLRRNHPGGRPSKRQDILRYAIQLAEEQGPKGFTIDALCERAGLSKGGIFYHFASVSELIEDMFMFYLEVRLPQWGKDLAFFTDKTRLTLSTISVKELTYLLEHAPVAANLERLVFKTAIESSRASQNNSLLYRLIDNASPAEKITLYAAFGARIARVFDLPGTPHHEDNQLG